MGVDTGQKSAEDIVLLDDARQEGEGGGRVEDFAFLSIIVCQSSERAPRHARRSRGSSLY
jgi:hypothetical protein